MKTNHSATRPEPGEAPRWFKSSYSIDDGGGSCVTVASLADWVGVRDSKHGSGPALAIPATAWTSFIREVQAERLGT
ncbi:MULTISPECIES: DUF397 domain-containing protein [Streptomyces]|uniref:DUF397 domain-containing protein n=1 Tax=Streptomyces griseocarneus TaxID=51201 RepID=A0ABX7RJU7_9ACTN|nr:MULTISPECIES: DUF397 domain-containing protein [Streptomyces]QSY47186.1 DUF397 domain-containing protein [Streptomyces griseocarneus]